MSTWTTPITFTSTTLTATQMNTEVRDHLNFLKGAFDVLTASTTADTGTTMFLHIVRPTAAGEAFGAAVTADTFSRFTINSGGDLAWGTGGVIQDTNLYRASANRLATDDDFAIGSTGLVLVASGYLAMAEMGAPASPAGGAGYLYLDDNGAGKTRLNVIFNTGAPQVIATQP